MKSNKVDIEIEVATFLVNVYVLFLCDKNHEMSNTSHHHHLLSVTCHGSSYVTCHVSRVTAAPAAPGATRPRAGCGSSLPPPTLGWIQYHIRVFQF